MKLKLLLALPAVVLLAACGGGDSDGGGVTPGQNGTVEAGAASLPAGKDCGIGNMPQQLIAAINAARAQARSCGGTAMPAAAPIPYWNNKLAESAARHSSDMASKKFMSHTGSDGSTSGQRNIDAGYSGGGSGDILSAPNGSFSAANQIVKASMNAWLASPGHCNVIMGVGSSELGAACVKSGSTAYVTVEFGK